MPRKLLINAVSCRAGGGLNDLVHTLPLLEQMLSPRGWTIETFVVEAGADALLRHGHPIDRVSVANVESPLRRANWELRTLPAIVRRDRPDVVFQFSNLIFRDLSVLQITVLRSQTFFSPEYASQRRRGVYQTMRYAVGTKIAAKTIERAAAVFCISQTQRNDIAAAHGDLARKVEVAHLGVSVPQRVRNADRIDQAGAIESLPAEAQITLAKSLRRGSRVLVNISHYYQQKNLLTLLRAVDEMSHRDPLIRLILTAGLVDYDGPGGLREREEKALALDLSRRGILADLGPVRKEHVWPLLQLADVFVFPSSLESFGHPLLEAMAVGTPVVASDTPIHREIAADATVYHDVFDPSSLADAVERVLTDAALRSTLIAAGEQRISRFTWEAHVQKLADAIERVAHAGSRQSLATVEM